MSRSAPSFLGAGLLIINPFASGCTAPKDTEELSILAVSLAPNGQVERPPLVRAPSARALLHAGSTAFHVGSSDRLAVTISDSAGWQYKELLSWGSYAVILLPHVWSLEGGRFDGHEVHVDKLLPMPEHASTLLGPRMRLWREVPISVHYDGTGSQQALESLAEAIATINEVGGRGILVFASEAVQAGVVRQGDAAVDAHYGILVSFDHLAPPLLGMTDLTEPRCSRDAGQRLLCSPEWIESSRVILAHHADVSVMTHELLHAVGLLHTCVVPSVMATEFSAAALSACAAVRYRLGSKEDLRLLRRISQYDAAALQIMATLSSELRHWRGDSLITAVRADRVRGRLGSMPALQN